MKQITLFKCHFYLAQSTNWGHSPDGIGIWNLVFEWRGKPEHPKKKLSEQGREPTTNSTDI